MGEAAVSPDLWTAIPVYEAYIQSIKTLKSDYDKLLAQRDEVDALKKKIDEDRQALQNERDKLTEDQKKLADEQDTLKAGQTDLAKAKGELEAGQKTLSDDRELLEKEKAALEAGERELLAQLGVARCENRELQNKIETLNKTYTDEIGELKNRLAEIIDDRDHFKRQNEVDAQKIQILSDRITQLELSNNTLKSENEALKNKNKELTNPSPSARPIIKFDPNTNGNLTSLDAVARFYDMTVEDIIRLNREVIGRCYSWNIVFSVYQPQNKCC